MSGAIAVPLTARARFSTRLCLWLQSHNLWVPALTAPMLLFLIVMMVLPLASIVLMSLHTRGEAGIIIPNITLENYIQFLATPVYLKILLTSMLVGLGVALATLALSFIPACVLALSRSTSRTVLLLLLIVPFWTSFLIRTYSWIILLGSQGAVNGALTQFGFTASPLPLLFNRWAVVLGLTHALLPFAVIPIYASVERIESAVLEAASTLGARPWVVFAEVIIPLSAPGIIAAGVLVFIEAMGAFITPQLLGGAGDMMISMLVQQRFLASYDWPFGSAVAVIYLLFTGLVVVLFKALRALKEM